MNILVFGGGAIGCHISYCMYKAGQTVYVVGRGKHLDKMKKYGMHIQVCDNEKLIEDDTVIKDERFKLVEGLNEVGDIENPVSLGMNLLKKVPEFRKLAIKAGIKILFA